MEKLTCENIIQIIFGNEINLYEYLIDKENREKLRKYIKENCENVVKKLEQGIEIEGIYEKGLGIAGKYISDPFYFIKLSEILGEKPFPGTLNIKIEKNLKNLIIFLKFFPSIYIEGDQEHGGVSIHRCKIFNEECLVLFPEKSRYIDVLEIISSKKISNIYNMEIGKKYKVLIFIKF